MPFSQTEKQIAALEKIYPKGFDLSLSRIVKLLNKLGNPHNKLPPVFHIAGTNGKGSTSAFCRAILEAHGLSVHTHTSPHLVHWNERYRIGNSHGSNFIDDTILANCLGEISKINDGDPITIFELLTATGFVLFSQYPADAVILEVGLGGRFDASNVIEQPEVSIITSLSFDHESFLGETIEQIAFEKSGIIKKNRPIVLAQQIYDEAIPVIEKQAQKMHAPFIIYGRDFFSFIEHNRMAYQDETGLMDLPLPSLFGIHQISNAATAIAALKQSRFELTQDKIEQGLQNVYWPGRMQKLPQGNLQQYLPPLTEVWIDGGHNPNASDTLAQNINLLQQKSQKRNILIFAMLQVKNPANFLMALQPLVDEIITIPIANNDTSYSAQDLAKIAQSQGFKAQASSDLRHALQYIQTKEKHGSDIRIIMTGSLYFMGDILAQNHTPPQ